MPSVDRADATTGVIEVDAGDARLHCETAGAGPLLICGHGFPDCARSFRLQVPVLVGAGFRVASLTMRGYAPSTRSRRDRYDAATLGRDLLAVADLLSPRARVGLIGHDWGAIAAYCAAALKPERIAALATLAVPHPRIAGHRFLRLAQLRRSWYMGLFQLPGAETRVRADGFSLIDRLWRDWSPGYCCPTEEMTKIKAAIGPNLDAVLGYYRALRSPSLLARRPLFAKTRVPGLYLHGRDDGCVGAELSAGVEAAYLAGARVEILDNCGHFLHLERPDAVGDRLASFFSRHARDF
jgi:pimeloyl-ACP methyl ester carboxylesterase